MRGIMAATWRRRVFSSPHCAPAADLPARAPRPAPPVAVSQRRHGAGSISACSPAMAAATREATAPFDANTGFFYNFWRRPTPPTSMVSSAAARSDTTWQSGAVVFGVEGEVGYLGLKGSAIEPNDLPNTNDTVTRFKSDLYGAIYGRLGIATGNALFYGKGGVAFLDAEASTIDPCVSAPRLRHHHADHDRRQGHDRLVGRRRHRMDVRAATGAPRSNTPISISARSALPARAASRRVLSPDHRRHRPHRQGRNELPLGRTGRRAVLRSVGLLHVLSARRREASPPTVRF